MGRLGIEDIVVVDRLVDRCAHVLRFGNDVGIPSRLYVDRLVVVFRHHLSGEGKDGGQRVVCRSEGHRLQFLRLVDRQVQVVEGIVAFVRVE